MTLSFNQLNDIASLYESIHYGTSEAEVLNEYAGGATPASQMGAPARPRFGPTPAQQAQTSRTALQKGANVTISKPSGDPLSRAFGGKDTAGTAHLNSAATKSQGRTVVNFNNTQPTYRSGSQPGGPGSIQLGGQKLYAAKLGGKDVFVSGKKSGTQQPTQQQRQPAAGTPPAAAAKPAPTAAAKPAGVPAKTAPAAAGDGMKAWAAAHPDLAAKVKSGQSGYNDIQQQRASAALKAPAAPASSTLGKTVAAASKPQTAFNPSVTPSAATAAAPSTSPAASGSVVPGTNKLAAMKQQPEVKPQAIAASYEYEDAYDVVLEYLLDTGHAESVAEAQYIMTELDQESINEIAEAYKKFPTEKVMNKAGKLMGSSAGKTDPASKKKENRGIKMMDKMMQHTPD
jgi:hypothetical protein